MLQTECLLCGQKLKIDYIQEGDGYFFGYDTNYYGMGMDDIKDPHEVIGYYCKRCGDKLRDKVKIEYKRMD